MKFLHAADIHLDSPMAGIARRDADLAEVTARCTRQAFRNLVDLAIAQDVAFVLIAGDLYNAEWKDYGTGLFFASEMRRLGRPCLMIRGNHDSASSITKSLQPPPNVTVFSSHAPAVVELREHGVAVHGQSFPNRAVPEDLAAKYRAPIPGLFNIGLLHSSVEDPGEHDSYAPCRIETLVNKGYDYWALGHIHTRATLHERPHVHFPGNPQGRHVRETGSRGATIVEVQDGAVASLTHHATDVLRWAALTIDAADAEDLADLSARLRFALIAARQESEGRPLIVRITVTGATALHGALIAAPMVIEAECRNAAAAAGDDVHIERMRIATKSLEAAADVSALETAFRAALQDPGLAAEMLKDFARLQAGIPADARVDVPQTPEALAALADDAWHLVRHALRQGDAA
jgi:exonuclease SbcD